ncbi:MAG: DUF4249 family protein [Bacillota bacterium]
MKNYIQLTIIILVYCLLPGCQQSEVLEPDTAFKEKIVVFANLKADKTFDGISLTRTLPLNTVYDIKTAEIKNAVAYMRINGTEIMPLAYDKDGMYKALHIITIHSGETYELFANIDGKKLYAHTYIPYIPEISTAQIVSSKYVQAAIVPRSNEVYGVVWIIPGANEYTFLGASQDFQEIIVPDNSKMPASMSLRTIDFPREYQSPEYLKKVTVKAYAFDRQYYDYFRTKSNSQQVNNPFSQGGGQTMWNIYGEDVIGLFMGSAEGSSVKPQ